MNAAHLHILINHVGVLGFAFGLGLGAFGLLFSKHDFVRAAFVIFVIAGVATIVTHNSGESAEDVVEHLAGVSEASVEAHEEAAKPAFFGGIGVGVLALLALIVSRKRDPAKAIAAGVLLAALALTGWNIYVSNLGGAIRHPEMHSGG